MSWPEKYALLIGSLVLNEIAVAKIKSVITKITNITRKRSDRVKIPHSLLFAANYAIY
jgi:hypothetical protein